MDLTIPQGGMMEIRNPEVPGYLKRYCIVSAHVTKGVLWVEFEKICDGGEIYIGYPPAPGRFITEDGSNIALDLSIYTPNVDCEDTVVFTSALNKETVTFSPDINDVWDPTTVEASSLQHRTMRCRRPTRRTIQPCRRI